GGVGGPIVDDQPLDGVEAVHVPWQPAERQRQLLLLVETRDLDDELHGLTGRLTSPHRPAVTGHFVGASFRSHGSGILVREHGCGNGSQGAGPQATPAVARAPSPAAPVAPGHRVLARSAPAGAVRTARADAGPA